MIAAPYYGSMTAPNQGISKLYFLVSPPDEVTRVSSTSLRVWNPETDPALGTWLQKNGVTAVCCSSIKSHLKSELQSKFNIQVLIHEASALLSGVFSWTAIEDALSA